MTTHLRRISKSFAITAACFTALVAAMSPPALGATRIKDLVAVKGMRANQLIGYGIVVGLAGTGDGKQAGFTGQNLSNVMKHMDLAVGKGGANVKNVASVMVTADLPAFVKAGQTIDVTLSSIGDASSLQGGTLLVTPLKGLDGKVYAMAQGAISIGGFETPGAAAAKQQKNHLTVARIPAGATVEQEVAAKIFDKENLALSLRSPDFTTVSRIVDKINGHFKGPYAQATDGATVTLAIPDKYRTNEVKMMAEIEALDVETDNRAKIVLDERTGTVVMGENVRINELALSHGSLSIQVSGPPPGQKSPNQEEVLGGRLGSKLMRFPAGTTLGEVVRALNSVGVTPRDLIAIFQTIKASGALQADLEII